MFVRLRVVYIVDVSKSYTYRQHRVVFTGGMTRTPASARTTPRRVRWLIAVGLIVVIAVITAAVPRLPGAEVLAPVVLLQAFFVPLAFLVALEPLGRSALEYAQERAS
jgi:hypothetical protein